MLVSLSSPSRSRHDHNASSAAAVPSLLAGEDNLTLLAEVWHWRIGSTDIRHWRPGGKRSGCISQPSLDDATRGCEQVG